MVTPTVAPDPMVTPTVAPHPDKERADFCEFFASRPGSTSLRGREEGRGARAQLEALFRRP